MTEYKFLVRVLVTDHGTNKPIRKVAAKARSASEARKRLAAAMQLLPGDFQQIKPGRTNTPKDRHPVARAFSTNTQYQFINPQLCK